MSMAAGTITGRVGKDPELKDSKGGSTYCRINLCVDEWDREAGENVPRWAQCLLFGRQAERAVEHVRKGCTVTIAGEFKAVTEDDVEYCGFRMSGSGFSIVGWPKDKDGGGGGRSRKGRGRQQKEAFDDDEDIPF